MSVSNDIAGWWIPTVVVFPISFECNRLGMCNVRQDSNHNLKVTVSADPECARNMFKQFWLESGEILVERRRTVQWGSKSLATPIFGLYELLPIFHLFGCIFQN